MNEKLSKIIAVVSEEIGKSDLTAETRFLDLGIDSLEFVCLIQAIERTFDCRVTDAQYPTLHTIGDLAAIL